MISQIKLGAKYLLAPILYKYPPLSLHPESLAMYLATLLEKTSVPGDVAEVGCNLGGTAVIASKVVLACSPEKKYFCFDTFEGFVPEQFDADVRHGTPESARRDFALNSISLVRRIMKMHDCSNVTLIKGDAAKINEDLLRKQYSVVLVDVDLSEPTFDIMLNFYSRLSKGGIMLVDDCNDYPGQRWKALLGYKRFCQKFGLQENYRHGLGMIER
jgi:hypothetical protein